VALGEEKLRALRGREIAMIFPAGSGSASGLRGH